MALQRNILLIRHQQAAERTRATLASHGHNSIILPLSKIELLTNPIPADEFNAIILTSPLAPQILQNHVRFESLIALPVFCVGEFTARCAKRAGFQHIGEIASDANCLAEAMDRLASGSKFLYPCAKNRSFDFASHLDGSGISCINWEIYSNNLVSPDKDEMAASLAATNTVFLFSKRTADHFFKVTKTGLAAASGHSCLSHHIFIAISQHAATTVPGKLQSNTYIAKDKNEISMIECLETIRR